MNISAELSLYPLSDDYIAIVKGYLADLNRFEGLEVRTHALSTEIFGDFETVMQAIQSATKTVFDADPAAVLVAKYLNRDRRDKSS